MPLTVFGTAQFALGSKGQQTMALLHRPLGFSPAEIDRFLEHTKQTQALFNMAAESFQMLYEQFNGVTSDELGDLRQKYERRGEEQLAEMLGSVSLMGKGSCMILVNPEDSPHTNLTKFFVLFARRDDQTYNLIVAKASQKKTIQACKVAAALGCSCVTGTVLTAAIRTAATGGNPVVIGLLTGAALAAMAGSKTAYDYNRVMDNVITGYVCKELQELGVIKVSNDSIILL